MAFLSILEGFFVRRKPPYFGKILFSRGGNTCYFPRKKTTPQGF